MPFITEIRPKDTHLIVIHKNRNHSAKRNCRLLRFATHSEPIAGIIFNSLKESYGFNNSKTMIAIPREWQVKHPQRNLIVTYYNANIPVCLNATKKGKSNNWVIISNGSFVTGIDLQRLGKILANFDDGPIGINADSALLSYRENVRITSRGNVAGFRRLYSNSILPAPVTTDWPHYIFVRPSILDKILVDGALPLIFTELVGRCKSNSLNWYCFNVGGTVLDLETEAGLLNFLTTRLYLIHHHHHFINGDSPGRPSQADGARIFGKVISGNNVQIGKNTSVIGPTILCDNVKVAAGATIRASVIGPDLSVPKNYLVQNRILVGAKSKRNLFPRQTNIAAGEFGSSNLPFTRDGLANDNFRTWPRLSYARCIKRIADITVSLIILMLFAPVLSVIAVAVKLSSPGPVFFRHKRQGLHGKDFYCLKFRTMIIGADKIQEKLRPRNQVDGPQFKVQNDPRVTATGRFLRDTFIDEIPQFINILLGQMSIVGPRPSPKSENSFCPLWRDARLSVRPGITGLWQVRRTRQPGRDFQEWIYYDTEYVRNLSARLDLSICWQTAKKLILNFARQF